MTEENKTEEHSESAEHFSPPSLSLPKGGGAIRGMGEKFAANPVTGTGSMTVPIYTSPGRSGFGPQLSLSYDSGSGNTPFGFGWDLSLPTITRKTDKGLPRYQDAEESDVYILSGAEDLVPVLDEEGSRWQEVREEAGVEYQVHRYRPRIEGLFARIERWTNSENGEIHWRSITKDNIITLYGRTNNSRIFDPADPDPIHPTRIFSWLICQSRDDKGNAMVYEYKEENSDNVDLTRVHEKNRTISSRSANRFIKCIKYGNQVSHLVEPDLSGTHWLFRVVFDYGEDHCEEVPLDPSRAEADQHKFVHASALSNPAWPVRPDPFSSYRPGFEVRTYRRCCRVLMFHCFAELGKDPYLVRSTEFDYADLDYSHGPTVEAELAHPGSTRFASFIRAVTHSGFLRDDSQGVLERDGMKYYTYLKKSLPPLEFQYSKAAIQEDVHQLDARSQENLPYGLDGTVYQWVDLDGEGVSGILTEQANTWFYKPNLGQGRFGPLEKVKVQPSLADLSSGRQQLLDLAGDGQLDLVRFSGATPGFFERTHNQQWDHFTPFTHLPNFSWDDPNLRFVDLNGDGHADVLITEQEVFTWHPSLAEKGFGPGQRVYKPPDEEKGPRLVFADSTQSIYLADMCGDGLTDLVRIRSGQVCYWPNLGYGRFGAKITMDNSPWFDKPEQFDHKRIRLADIDGSGSIDIIYLEPGGVSLYFNESGNRWSEPRHLDQFPRVDNLSSIRTVDFFGNGTACLVWSSPLPGDTHRPIRYIDLMGGQKPHLLVSVKNNLGAETHVHYAPSTRFYLEDKAAGKPWLTRLPFPVHVVERVEIYDRISRNRFVTRYAYHHGYFDGMEREFRGFALVEQWDSEEFAVLNTDDDFPEAVNIDRASHVPPVLTRTWFHTGAYIEGGRVSRQMEKEYYRESDPSMGVSGLTDEQQDAMLLEDTLLPIDLSPPLSPGEAREACRALKGSVLRQETYACDGTEEEDRPYLVSERNYTLKRLQPRGENKHAVFFAHPRETIDFHYERKLYDIGGRKLADPRVTHTMVLAVDDYGNVRKSVAIGYGRRHDPIDPLLTPEDKNKQKHTLVSYTENHYTYPVLEDDAYRIPLLCETRRYELLKIRPSAGLPDVTNLFRFHEMQERAEEASDGSHDLPYEDVDAAGAVEDRPYRRLIEHIRILYRRNDLSGPLPLYQLQSLALPFESCKLAFTPGLITGVYGDRVTDAMLENDGAYVHSESDSNWWIPSGQVFYSPGSSDTFSQELDWARQHFFLPHRYRDPFHNDEFNTETTAVYDGYHLLVQETRDTLGNRVTAGERDPDDNLVESGLDYRVLKPKLVTDPNRNRSAVVFDALGLVVGTALMGKPGESLGDSLEGFEPDLTGSVIAAQLDNPLVDPHGILQRATRRLVYDLFAYQRSQDDPQPQPGVVYTLARETHDADLPEGQPTRIRHCFLYSDGFGREIQKKIQAEPGPLAEGGPEISPRWVGSGWTIFNNKGKPIRKYEPFFDDSHDFRFGKKIGVSSILFYDPVERVVATLHPNHTYEKIIFDPWRQETWDVNDTVLLDPRSDDDIRGFTEKYFQELEDLPDTWQTWHASRVDGAMGPQEQTAAIKAAVHANTPAVTYFDTLGRIFLKVASNKFQRKDEEDEVIIIEEKYLTRVKLDIEGTQRAVIDAKNRIVMNCDYDIPGSRIHQASMEAGERRTLNNAAGKPIYAWDSRGHRFHTQYDQLQRPTHFYLFEGAGPGLLVGHTIYGETQSNPEDSNLRGQVVQVFDQAGVVTSEAYDFKGNLLRNRRQLAKDYKTTLDWSAAEPPSLETPIYTSCSRFDAFNRPIQLIVPHSDQPGTKVNVIQPIYNEANLLDQVHAWLDRDTEPSDWLSPDTANLHAVTNIDYNARGQRTFIRYGNDVSTEYTYDPQTFRLVTLLTRRSATAFPDDCPGSPPLDWPGCQVQNLHYTYDPVGNITYIRDDARQTIYFRNRRVEPSAEYTYDAVYRLIEAAGREHLGQVGGHLNPPTAPDAFNLFHSRRDHPGNGNAMGTYIEEYIYDAVGNILAMQHRGSDPVHPGWTRTYAYNETSHLQADKMNNRLSSTTIGTTTETYRCDGSAGLHGSITRMPHLANHPAPDAPNIHWDSRDQLSQADLGGGGTAFFVYDTNGQRVRKVWEKTPGLIEEHIYFNGFEIFRRHNGTGDITLERQTLHIMDNRQRVALVETRTRGSDPAPAQLIRYQFSNHLGSANLELDDQAQVIAYEEFYPFGSASYQAVRSQTETPKRYRYSGKERDEETGLFYHGARYYAPWLARWVSCDPYLDKYFETSPYSAMGNNPITFSDRNGKEITVERIEGQPGERPLIRIHVTAVLLDETPNGIRVRTLRQIREQIEQTIERDFTGESENLRWETQIDLRIVGSEPEIRPGEHVFRIRRRAETSARPEAAIQSNILPTGETTPGGEEIHQTTYHRGIYLSTEIWRLEGSREDDWGYFAAHGLGHALGLIHSDTDPEAPPDVGPNLMHSTYNSPGSGNTIQEYQILQIERSFNGRLRQYDLFEGEPDPIEGVRISRRVITARIDINGSAQREEGDTFVPERIRRRLPPEEVRRLLRRQLRETPTAPTTPPLSLEWQIPAVPVPGLLNPGSPYRFHLEYNQ